jgi:hypothetical protein
MHWFENISEINFSSITMRFADRQKRRFLLIVLVFALTVFGVYTVSSARGIPATKWMNIFHPGDFKNFNELVTYLEELRIPVPPVFSVMEIVNFQISGDYRFVTNSLYRLGLVLVYIVALVWASGSYRRMLTTFFISSVFLWGTRIVHRGNPQVYDIYFPLFILLFLLFTKLTASERFSTGKWAIFFSILSGFFLSMAELTRPFMILFLPFLVIWVYFKLGKMKKRYFLYFLIPVLLFSGLWHLKLLVFNGQWTWSNHGGYNLAKCWVFVEKPPLIPEPGDAPTAPGRWKNLNTPEHLENSRRLQSKILNYVLLHPLKSAAHIFRRFTLMMTAPTSLYKYNPLERYPALYLYKFLATLLISYLFINIFRLILMGFKAGRGFLKPLLEPGNVLIVLTFLLFVIVSIGESGEESRFLISLLPLLAVVPSTVKWKPESKQ